MEDAERRKYLEGIEATIISRIVFDSRMDNNGITNLESLYMSCLKIRLTITTREYRRLIVRLLQMARFVYMDECYNSQIALLYKLREFISSLEFEYKTIEKE